MKYKLIDTAAEPGLAYWASYFINGDASGMSDEDQAAEADAWLTSVQPPIEGQHASVVDCGESYIARYWGHTKSRGLLADVCVYTLAIYEKE